MITIKCKCGTMEMTFQSLSEKDFPNGWETDCCLEMKAKKAERQPEVPEELVEPQVEAVQAVEGELAESTSEEAPAPDEKEQPKRRGRKPKA